MPRDKKRLHVAVYPAGGGPGKGGARQLHWAFLIGPKDESKQPPEGVKCHIRPTDPTAGWQYEEIAVPDVQSNTQLLARITIAKIQDEQRLLSVLQGIPLVQDDTRWRDRSWMSDAIKALKKDGKAVNTHMLDWNKIETQTIAFVDEKVLAGRYDSANDLQGPKPTWTFLGLKEVIY